MIQKCKFQVYTCTCAFVFACLHVRVHLCVSTMLPKLTGFKADIHNNIKRQPQAGFKYSVHRFDSYVHQP